MTFPLSRRALTALVAEAKADPNGPAAKALRSVRRSDWLPALFKIRGQRYSLDNYPQFREMYDRPFIYNILWICGRQVGKSLGLSRSEVMAAASIQHFQILYVSPLQQQSQRYSLMYLSEAISSFSVARELQSSEAELQEGPVVKSVAHKAFSNGSGIQLTYSKTSPDRARGIMADMIDFDEVQDQLADHIPIISESITGSTRFGIRRFTGTARTTDNIIEVLRQQSTMSEWAIRCPACGYWNIPDRDHNVLDMIHTSGVVCSHCRRVKGMITKLDVRVGEWVHARPEMEREFLGFHIPQIIIPAIVEDPNRWYRLVSKVLHLPPALIYPEILGLAYDTGVRLITQEDIDKVSDLPSHVDLHKWLGKYQYIALGIDWGISEVTSYTVATVVGVTINLQYDVLFGKRYVGQDISEIIDDLERMYRSYKCSFVAPDFGVGFTNNQLLKQRKLSVIQIQYVVQNTFLRFNEMHGVARWMVDRNTALSSTFFGIRSGRIHFPAIPDSKNYTGDLLSPYEHVYEESSGISKKKFLRDPNRPDDFCHALTFALMTLMYVMDDDMLKIAPEHAPDYEGAEFPVDGANIDMISQLGSATG